ncbi:MAG: hypothetical protein RLZZ546_283 [Bacteroidota bacterium]
MKEFRFLILIALLNFSNSSTFSQIQIPWPTTASKSETTVGLTNITLDYSRPSKNGRKIFGALVPYDSLWRTAANKNSMITFSTDVKVEKKALKKGTYAIYTKPGREVWEIYFYTDFSNMGLPSKWDTFKIAATIKVKPIIASITETFEISIDNIAYESCLLEINWDNISVPMKIEVPTDEIVSENINRVLNGPSAWDYYNAADHNRRAKKDLHQALKWMNMAIEKGSEEDYMYFYRKKSLIEADLMDYKAAINSANIDLKYAQLAKNKDYIKMNLESINEWKGKL